MPETALKEMINCLEDDNFVGAAVAIEDHYENPFITSVLESKAPSKSDHVLEIVEQLNETPHHHLYNNETEQAAYAAFISLFNEISFDSFECAYQGQHRNDIAFAEYMVDECCALEIPEHLEYYFNYEAYARDIMINDYTEEDGYYFSRHW